MSDEGTKTAVVIGGYGLIGSACLAALKRGGFRVIGVGRSSQSARRCDPSIEWRLRDVSRASAEDWRRDLHGADVIVNAAGALQDGLRDDLKAIHEGSMARMVEALAGSRARFIQISAAGVSEEASTEFFRSKARGDRRLMDSSLDWVVLRPTLVLSPHAYGGTALLRAAATTPLIGFALQWDAPIQTVAVDDVARAVVQVARGEIAAHTVADLTESDSRPLGAIVVAMRAWLGFAPWRRILRAPDPLVRMLAMAADALGWLGWRSPLRTTALTVLEDGVRGDPAAWERAGGALCRDFDETLLALPSTAQERWFARLYLLTPVIACVLALFWITSGAIGAASWRDAAGVLTVRGVPPDLARGAVFGGALVDVALGAALLVRRWSRAACLGMVAVSLAYLAGGTVWAPDLWADPLGPLVKVVPGIALALVAACLLEER